MKSLIPRKYPFQYAEERDFIITHKNDAHQIAKYVDQRFQDDFSKAEDLIDWSEVLDILVLQLKSSPVFSATFIENPPDVNEVDTSVSILVFLGRLIRAAKDKRCFVGFTEIHSLMKSPFPLVSQLACEVMFHVCVPASSISSNVHDDWADCIEVPMFVATTVQKIFSTIWTILPNGSFVKYLSNAETLPDSALDTAVRHIIGRNDEYITNLLKSGNFSALGDALSEIKSESDQSEFLFLLFLAYKTWSSKEFAAREMYVRTMLFAFFVLIHSKVSATEVLEYVKTGSAFTNDLVSLGDVSRNTLKYPSIVDSLPMAHVCLENILGLIESRLRRRSSMTLNSNILEVLNLDGFGMNSTISSSEDMCWISIVSSASSNATILFEPGHKATQYSTVGKFTRLGLELYALALTVRDQSHLVTDIRIISTIVGLLRACGKELKSLIECDVPDSLSSSRAVQLMLVVSKILYCMELTVQKSGYLNVFRECDGLEPVVELLILFANYPNSLDTWFSVCPFAGSILETALSVITISILKYRPSATVGRSLNESGYTFLFSPSFFQLGQKIMSHLSGSSDTVWGEYLMLVKEVIDYEPTYLALFLQSELVEYFKRSFSGGVQAGNWAVSTSRIDLENILGPLLRFAYSACITNEGRTFLVESGIIEFVIDGIQHPLVTVPYSYGYATEKISKIGGLLGQILVESYPQFRPVFLNALKSKLDELLGSIEVHVLSSEFMSGTSPESPRIQFLQRMTNLCTVIEQMFSASRRHQTDLIRDIVVDYIPKLFLAYQCAFPPLSQLLTQLSLHTNTSAPSIGNAACMKSITTVLKVASVNAPQELMQHILKSMEETINKVSTAKMLLSKKETLDTSEELQIPGKGKKNRSRGSSFGTQSATQSHVYGALENIPDATIVTKEFSEFLSIDEANEKYLWQFVTGVATVEWMCLMLSHSLRSIHRSNNHTQIANLVGWKENLRHLFSFLKSASLEVATFSVQYIRSKTLDQCKMKSSLDVFLFESGLRPVLGREVDKYFLRVIGTGGALVREGVEIDGSRVVFVTEIGAEIVAYERKLNAAGVIRYRTDLGWISEYRRDQSKSPIVEIVSVETKDVPSDIPSTYASEISVLMTIREGIYCVMSRLNQSLRQVSVYLARLLTVQEQRVIAYNPQSFSLATAMSKYYKGFMDYVDERLGDGKTVDCLKSPVRAMYMANFIKNAMIPALEDKNGNYNILLLRSFSLCGLMTTLIEDWLISINLLKSETSSITDNKLSPCGRCALYSTQIFIIFIRKLVNRDVLKKSASNRSALSDENGSFTAPDLIAPVLCSAAEAVSILLKEVEPTYFSSDMSSDVLSSIVELYRSLKGAIADLRTVSRDAEIPSSRPESRHTFTSLRSRTLINRFLDLGFTREHITRCMNSALNPSNFEEVYELLVSTLGSETATTDVSAAVPMPIVPSPEVGIDAQETFHEQLNDMPVPPPHPINPETTDSLPDLVSNLGIWDDNSNSGRESEPQPLLPTPAPAHRQSSRGSDNRRNPATILQSLLANVRATSAARNSLEQSKASKSDQGTLRILETTVATIECEIVTYCRRLCEYFHHIERWDRKETFSLFPHMRTVVQTVTKVGSLSQDLLKLLIDDILASLQTQLNVSGGNNVIPYGLIIFFSSINKGEDIAIGLMQQRLSYAMLLALLQSASSFIDSSLQNNSMLPKYVAPAIVLVSQVLSFLQSDEAFIQEQFDLLLKTRVEGRGEISSTEIENHAKSVLLQVYNVLHHLLTVFQQHPSTGRVYCSVLDALAQITSYHTFADLFIANEGLQRILALVCTDNTVDSIDNSSVGCFSRLLQKCLQTPAILQIEFAQVIKGFFKALPSQESKISFDKFLRGHFLLVSRSPEDFWLVVTKLLKFSKSHSSESNNQKVLMVELLGDAEVDQPLARKTDRSYLAVKVLVDHCAKLLAKQSSENETPSTYFTFSDCINVLAETSLSVRHGANIVSFVATNMVSEQSFIEYLLHHCFSKVRNSATRSAEVEKPDVQLQACTRLFLGLSATRGASRTIVCSAIVSELRSCASKICEDSSLIDTVGVLLQRICRLMVLICQSNKVNPNEGDHRRDQVMAIDTVKLLVVDGHVMDHLVSILLNLDQQREIDSKIWVSVLSAIALFSRPQLLHHLEKILEEEQKATDAARATQSSTISVSTPIVVSSGQRSHRFHTGSILEEDSNEDVERLYYGENTPLQARNLGEELPEGSEEQLNRGFHMSEQEDDDDDNDIDEEEDENENEGSEEGENDEGDEEDEEDEDDDEDDDNEENEEDEEFEGFAEDVHDHDEEEDEANENDGFALFNGANGHGPVTISINVDGNEIRTTTSQPDIILNELSNALRRSANNDDSFVHIESMPLPAGDRARQSELLATTRSAFEAENQPASRSQFATPPEQDRTVHALLRSMAEGIEPRDGSILEDVFRRLGLESGHPGAFPSAYPGMGGVGAANQQIGDDELLPMGVPRALEPLSNQVSNYNPYVNQSIVSGRANRSIGGRLSHAFGAGAQNAGGPFAVYDMPGAFRDEVSESTPDVFGEEGEISMPAMWPGGGHSPAFVPPATFPRFTPGFPRPATSNGTTPTPVQPTSGNLDNIARAFQERFESLLLPDNDNNGGDESVADASASQTSTTVNSRTGPTFDNGSLPSTSVQAVQDPNPRQNGGEEDSVRGGPIPPVIDMESPDHESYEEMSVLTVPQEEQHDDAASRAMGSYRSRIPLRDPRVPNHSGESVTGSVDDQESLRTTPNPGTVVDDDHTIRTFPPIEEEVGAHDQEGSDDEDDDDSNNSHHDSITMGGVSALDNDTFHSESRVFDNDEGVYSLLDASEASVISGGGGSMTGMADHFPMSETPQIPEVEGDEVMGEVSSGSDEMDEESVPVVDGTEISNILPADSVMEISSVVPAESIAETARMETLEGENEATPTTEGQLVCPPGYDVDVFYSLPPEMQMEVIEQHNETADQMRDLVAASGFDYETIMSLPDDIRQEVLDQARRQRESERALLNPTSAAAASADGSGGAAAAAAPAEVDNVAFLSSLPLELRAEVLLTAEQEFLDSLPADVQAEAQTLRERAASNWQRREMMQGAGLAAGIAEGNGGPVPVAASMLHRHHAPDGDDYESEEEDEEYYGDGEIALPGGPHSRLREMRSPFERHVSRRPQTGLVQIKADMDVKFPLPSNLLMAITRVLVSGTKYPSHVTDTLLQVLQNICRTNLDKYDLAKLLVGLVTNQSSLIEELSKKFDGLDLSSIIQRLGLRLSSSPNNDALTVFESERLLETSSTAWRRIVFMLATICTQGSTMNLLGLLPRTSPFTVEFEAGGKIIVRNKDSSSTLTVHTGALADDVSTESLLEQIVRALPHVLHANNAQDLEIVSQLIDNISLPLDSLPEHADNFVATLPEGQQAEQEKTMKVVSVAVPPVLFDRDSLAILCDVLMSDLSNGRVVRSITSMLSRLAKFRTNASVVVELMCDVLGEIGGQTKHAVDQFTGGIRRSTLSLQQQHAASTSSFVSSSSNATTAAETGTAEVALPAAVPLGRIPSVAVIPLVDSVDLHVLDRFVRVIQTLHFISEKSSSDATGASQRITHIGAGATAAASLYDLTSLETINQVWTSLEHALAALKVFIEDDDSLDAEGIKSTPKLTSLLSAARRLLPLVESFFVIYASDLLREADAESNANNTNNASASSSTVPATTVTVAAAAASSSESITEHSSVPSTNESPPSSATEPPPPPAAAQTSAHQTKIPGQRYRNTAEYRRANISLPDPHLAAGGLGLVHSNSVGGVHSPTDHHLHTLYPMHVSMSRTRSFNYAGAGNSGEATRYRRLVHFVHNHRALLNVVIKSKPTLLDSSLAPLIRVTQLRTHVSFEVKRKYFFGKLKRLQDQQGRRGMHLQIRRNQVFEDSYQQLRGRSAADMRGRMQIQFYGEQGIDAGGLTREWYSILAREIFNPGYALFMAAADGATFQPNPLSFINSNHLDYFKFVGRVIGKAICDGQLMDAHFTRSFYKHLLGMPIEFNDIEATEPDYYKSLKMMLEHPLEDLGFTGMTFTAEIQKFGRTEDVELIPNGAAISVTDENKHDYVRLIAHHRMTAGIFPQIDSFLAGFYELVPPELICIFSPTELELLICGLPDVNIDELQIHTEYHQYRPTDPVIQWFWEALRSFNREERALFLQFITGTSKVPLGGFAHLQGMRGSQKFTIHKSGGAESGTLPSAHTCYNQLDLPEYESAEIMREKLLIAITEGSEGFGFA